MTSKRLTEQFKKAQETLAKHIRENRPNITDSSIKTYVSLLSNLYYKDHDRNEPMDISFFRNQTRILQLLDDKTPQTRKTVLASIIVLNGKEHTNQFIEKKMKEDMEETRKIDDTQTKSEKQKENWESYDNIKLLHQSYLSEAEKILNEKGKPDEAKLHLLTRFMMLSLSSGVYMPPRRSEMVLIKIKDYDPAKDNYIDLKKGEFVYNQYKTVKKYGEQRVAFSPEFKPILKKYLAKVNGQTYLLERNGRPFLATELTREMHNIFGKKISTSMLRHIYLSEVYKNVPALQEMKERASDMGHSISESLKYVKQ